MTNAQLGFVLHYYQPPTQDPELIKAVANQTYAPSAEALPSGMTINISGILLELLNLYGRNDIVDGWKDALKQKEIEILRYLLVSCQASIVGYSLLSLILASSVVNCQLIFDSRLFL